MGQTRDGIIGRPLVEILKDRSDLDRRRLLASLDRVIRAKVGDTTTLGNRERSVNTPVLDAGGELRYVMHVVEDMTEMVRLESALDASNAELDAFSYSVSHDLRAPLRAVQGFSQALLEDYGSSIDPKGQDYLARVSSAALRMSGLLDDLLELSGISRASLERRPVDLAALATTTAADLARTSGRQVKVRIASELKANADARLMRTVFEKLLENAWKFTSKTGDPAVEVGSQSIDGEVVFVVRDNGAGFDPTYASKLFAPFQRLHSEKDFPRSGSGIGLAVVQRIVRRHGGRVWAEAAENAGATFYFTLPD